MDNLTGIIAVLGALSLSVERVVQMIKNIAPFLSKNYESSTAEGWRKTGVQIISVIVGTIITYYARTQIQQQLPSVFGSVDEMNISTFVIFGLLASGGSAFWNHSLSIVEEVKKAKKSIADAAAAKAAS